jgi:hypothetical protein
MSFRNRAAYERFYNALSSVEYNRLRSNQSTNGDGGSILTILLIPIIGICAPIMIGAIIVMYNILMVLTPLFFLSYIIFLTHEIYTRIYN